MVGMSYTDAARKAAELAGIESWSRGHDYIGAEHIVVGLTRLDAETSTVHGILPGPMSYGSAAQAFELLVPSGNSALPGIPPFNNGGQKIIEYAREEAAAMGHQHVDAEHLYLGAVRQEKGPVVQLLGSFGVTADQLPRLRRQIVTVSLYFSHQPVVDELMRDDTERFISALAKVDQNMVIGRHYAYPHLQGRTLMYAAIERRNPLAIMALLERKALVTADDLTLCRKTMPDHPFLISTLAIHEATARGNAEDQATASAANDRLLESALRGPAPTVAQAAWIGRLVRTL